MQDLRFLRSLKYIRIHPEMKQRMQSQYLYNILLLSHAKLRKFFSVEWRITYTRHCGRFEVKLLHPQQITCRYDRIVIDIRVNVRIFRFELNFFDKSTLGLDVCIIRVFPKIDHSIRMYQNCICSKTLCNLYQIFDNMW